MHRTISIGFIIALFLGASTSWAAPEISHLTLIESVPLHGKQEVAFGITGLGEVNPYDPNSISVMGEFSAPSGKLVNVAGFYFVPDNPIGNAVEKQGTWKLRFAAIETGTYLLRINVSERKKTAQRIATVSFDVYPSERTGFVRRDGRSFKLSTGEPFFPAGVNRCWSKSASTEKYLRDMEDQAANGINCIRVWLAPWWMHLEEKTGIFNAAAAARLDAIVEKADVLNQRIILCIEQHGNLQPAGAEIGHWPLNPYNAANGGPCKRRIDFFKSKKARQLFKNRLRYIMARWGYSRSIMAWELFNEIEWIHIEKGGFEWNRKSIRKWHEEMSKYLRTNDPFGHLIATSSDIAIQKKIAKRNAVDLLTVHVYKDDDLSVQLRQLISDLYKDTDLPLLLEEYGHINDGDAERRITRASFIMGFAGVGAGAMPWLQDVDNPKPFYKRIMTANRFFQKKLRWSEEEFEAFAGKISIEFIGDDLTEMLEPVHLIPLSGKTQTIIFAFSGSDLGIVQAPRKIQLKIPDMTEQKYSVEIWSPVYGNVASRSMLFPKADILIIPLEEFTGETAIIIENASAQ